MRATFFGILFFCIAVTACAPVNRETVELRDIDKSDVETIEQLILDDRMAEAMDRLKLLNPTPVQKALIGLIKSYEFVPEFYEPLQARELLESYKDHTLDCLVEFPVHCLELNSAVFLGMSRQLICDSPIRELSMWTLATDAYSANYWHIFLRTTSDLFFDMASGKSKPKRFMIKKENRTRIYRLAIEQRTIEGQFALAALAHRQNYEDWQTDGPAHNRYVENNPIGSCLHNLVPFDRARLEERRQMLTDLPESDSFLLLSSPLLSGSALNYLVAYGDLSDSKLNEYKRIETENDFVAVPELTKSLQQKFLARLPDRGILLGAYCHMAFGFALWEELKARKAYERCIRFRADAER